MSKLNRGDAASLDSLHDAVMTLQENANGGSSSPDVALVNDIDGNGARGYLLNTAALARMGEKWQAVYGDVRYAARSVINLRFDDGKAESYTTVFPELYSRGLTGDFCVIKGGAFNPANGYITSAQAQEMQSKGMHFLSHSKTHGADPASLAEFITEVTDPIAYFNGFFLYVDGFVQPGTWVDTYNFDTVAKIDGTPAGMYLRQYATSQHYVLDDIVNSAAGQIGQALPVRRKYGFAHVDGDTLTLANLQSRIDNAISYGVALCIVFHPQYIGTAGNISLADFQAALDYIKTKRDGGLVDVLTGNGMAYALPGTPANWLGDPTFTKSVTGTPVIWQGNGASWAIETPSAGVNAAKVNSTNYLKQLVGGINHRTIRLKFDIKRATAGVAATARVRFRTYDSTGAQRGSAVDKTISAGDAFTTNYAYFGLRTDAESFSFELQSTDANFVHFANLELAKR